MLVMAPEKTAVKLKWSISVPQSTAPRAIAMSNGVKSVAIAAPRRFGEIPLIAIALIAGITMPTPNPHNKPAR